jgi:hypothetical protein
VSAYDPVQTKAFAAAATGWLERQPTRCQCSRAPRAGDFAGQYQPGPLGDAPSIFRDLHKKKEAGCKNRGAKVAPTAPSKAPTIQYCPPNAACIPVAPDIAEAIVVKMTMRITMTSAVTMINRRNPAI